LDGEEGVLLVRRVGGGEDDEHGDAGAAEEDDAGEGVGRAVGDVCRELKEAEIALFEFVVGADGDGFEGVRVAVEGVARALLKA
jgi:hypothetical protein